MNDLARPLVVQLFTPIPPFTERDPGGPWHGGLKVDRESEVGRLGSLLEWHVPVRSADAGMPPEVARIFAEALCAVGPVAGCTQDLPAGVGAAWTPVPGGHAYRFTRPWWRGPRHDLGLRASRDPAVVARMFDDETFPWSHEYQTVFLCAPDTLPALDRATVEACLVVPMTVTPARLSELGVLGLLNAGVDGDVAGMYVFDPAVRASLTGALAETTRRAGARWEEIDGRMHWSARPPADARTAAVPSTPA